MSNWPVAFAAIAAFFSAVAAISAYRLQKKVAFQSFAPLISLSGWQTNRTQIVGCIEVRKIRNYGQGPALRMHAFEKSQRHPLYYPRTERNTVQAVLPQEERDIAWQLFLENASAKPLGPLKVKELKHMNFQVVLSYSDINNRRYYTIYDLLYLRRERGDMLIVASGEKLTPELILKKQKTIVRYNWFVRLMGNLHLTVAKVQSKASSSLTFFRSKDKNKKTV